MSKELANTSQPPARNDWSVLGRIWAYLRQDWHLLLMVLGTLVLVSISQAVAPALIGVAIDQYITADDRDGLANTMLFLLGMYVLGWIGFMGQIQLMGIVSQRLLKRLRGDIFAHVQRLDLGYFARQGTGDLMSRLVNDIDTIGTLFSQSLTQALGSIFSLVGVIIAMFALDWRLSIATLLILPVMFAVTFYFSGQVREVSRLTRRTLGALSSSLEEGLSSVREAQAFARTALNVQHFEEDNAANRDANLEAARITSAFAPTMNVLSTIAKAIVAGVGGWMAFGGLVTVGLVVAFINYTDQFFRPVQQISGLYTQMQSAFAASERVFEVLDTSPRITNPPDAQLLPSMTGHVHFNEVVFGYVSEHIVLKGMNLDAQSGETVALVGTTGSGKSTIINLVTRFYDPNDGAVFIDGHDIRTVTINSLRRQMAEVPQDSFLFARTIADNIRYGQPDATMEEVIAAAETANAHDFIQALPDGYQTILSERGRSLSQGQRQLLCIARAILANPRLLILDEATSSIDTRTERRLQAAIDKLLEGRTSFVIAHRLSTVRNADKILVIDDGQIAEQGTHDALLAQNGIYADLYQRQTAASG
ncbi:MAG: ABC transporter ATP-binding protein [Ardenticatenaceae bacterium]